MKDASQSSFAKSRASTFSVQLDYRMLDWYEKSNGILKMDLSYHT